MARTVNKLPETKKRDRYPWSRWRDGRCWKVKPVKEFNLQPEPFRKYVVLYASRKGVKVSTRVVGDAVTFQFAVAQNT